MNDLGAACQLTEEIQGVFRMMYDDLQKGIREWDGDEPDADDVLTYNGVTEGNELRDKRHGSCLLHQSVAANYRNLERVRDRVLRAVREWETGMDIREPDPKRRAEMDRGW